MRVSPFLEALTENVNVLAMAGVVAGSLITSNLSLAIAGAVAEVGYLLFVPDTAWYRNLLRKRAKALELEERQKLVDAIFPTLAPDVQARYRRLEELRRLVEEQCSEGQEWYRSVLPQMDDLMAKFLTFASKAVQFQDYIRTVLEDIREAKSGSHSPKSADSERSGFSVKDSRNKKDRNLPKLQTFGSSNFDDVWIDRAIDEIKAHFAGRRADLAKRLENDEPANTKAILQKQDDILERREAFVSKIGGILLNLRHQLNLVEDTFGLINDEIQARTPEQIMTDIEDVMLQTESMSQALDEVGAYEQLTLRAS